MLGISTEIKTVYLRSNGHKELEEWLSANKVEVIDIKPVIKDGIRLLIMSNEEIAKHVLIFVTATYGFTLILQCIQSL